jgi:hypothetical protein
MTSKAMERRSRINLKSQFTNGLMPSGKAFSQLIDSMLNILDEGFDKTPTDGLKVSQINQGKLISFYQNIDIKSPIWSVQLAAKDGALTFGNADRSDAMSLRQLPNDPAAPASAPAFELDVAGHLVADGRAGRPGAFPVKADGGWYDITETLEGCHALEVVAGVGKRDSGKYALLHAFAIMAFNGKGDIDIRQSYFGSKCNRLQLQWAPAKDGTRHAYVLQMRVGCPYDASRDVDPKSGSKTRVNYTITSLWFDPRMDDCAPDSESQVQA